MILRWMTTRVLHHYGLISRKTPCKIRGSYRFTQVPISTKPIVGPSRSFTTSQLALWRRKGPSLKARPRPKTKTRKSAAARWSILANGKFLRSRSNLNHGNTIMDLSRKERLRRPKFATTQQANFLKKVMPSKKPCLLNGALLRSIFRYQRQNITNDTSFFL